MSSDSALQVTDSGLPDILPSERKDLVSRLPPRLALRYLLLPIQIEKDEESDQETLILHSSDIANIQARAAVGRQVDCSVRWIEAEEEIVRTGIAELYGVGADTFDELQSQGEEDNLASAMDGDEANQLDDDDEDALVVKFVNQILRDALASRATDIHIEPVEDDIRIRYRIDGVLQNASVPQDIRRLRDPLLSRLKVMAKLDIAERRRPQDGRIALTLDGSPIDVRVATIPSVDGESISLRLLSREKYSLTTLGFNDSLRTRVEQLLQEPNGIVLVTGPTGSGKSTTLYSFLSALNSEDRRIVTIEDPVEHKLPGVVQIAVKPDIDLTFATGLRSILRGDPNVIMIGEIRDSETAQIAIRSAQTGHLVFSTLHTNDAIGGITRLLDMGIEPYLIASSVRAFFAQRLVRRLCPHCRISEPVPEALKSELPPTCDSVWEAAPRGCKKCRNTGYFGRMAIYELCEITPQITALISSNAAPEEIYEEANRSGYRPMKAYGWDKVANGDTTIAEVIRSTTADTDR